MNKNLAEQNEQSLLALIESNQRDLAPRVDNLERQIVQLKQDVATANKLNVSLLAQQVGSGPTVRDEGG